MQDAGSEKSMQSAKLAISISNRKGRIRRDQQDHLDNQVKKRKISNIKISN
jgi:hypothetical protein